MKKPTGKIFLVEAIIHLHNKHKDVVYALQIGIRNKALSIWQNFKAILMVLSILYPRKHWFWLFPYYADNQITIKVKKKITNFDLEKEERRREKKFSDQRQLLFILKTETRIIFYNIF